MVRSESAGQEKRFIEENSGTFNFENLKRGEMILAFLLSILLIGGLNAQVTLVEAPVDKQLYARSLTTDSAYVTIEGTVNSSGVLYDHMRVKVYRNNTLVNTLSQELAFSGNTASFQFAPTIKAELANYKFEVYGVTGSEETLVETADEVVAGDVIIIQGQSNAVASSYESGANVDQSPFIRVYGSANKDGFTSSWFQGDGDAGMVTNGNTGQWGMRLARLILNSQNIPIGIFNGAFGGRPIEYFQCNDEERLDQTTNYGRLLKRVTETNLKHAVRAVIWHQGEANSYGDVTAMQYKTLFGELRDDWLVDFPMIEKFYVFQIRNGCGCGEEFVGIIKEAQRQLAEELENVEIMSTSGEDHFTDNCHYGYENGYKLFGEHIYGLVARDLYGVEGINIEPPQVAWADKTGDNEITLILRRVNDDYAWAAGAESDFTVEGASVNVTSVVVEGHRVVLTLSGSVSNVTSISYNGHQDTGAPMVRNANGIGAVHFYQFPVTGPLFRDSAHVQAILAANVLIGVPVSSVTTTDADNRIVSLDPSGQGLFAIPPEIGYLDRLTSINMEGNVLSDLPQEIAALSPVSQLNVNGNALCDIPDAIADWIDEFSDDPGWRQTQICASGVESLPVFSEEPFSVRSLNGSVYISFQQAPAKGEIRIFGIQGKLSGRIQCGGGRKLFTWSKAKRDNGIYYIVARLKNGVFTKKVMLF
jgi:Leucine-rich repeat (LRR) protein